LPGKTGQTIAHAAEEGGKRKNKVLALDCFPGFLPFGKNRQDIGAIHLFQDPCRVFSPDLLAPLLQIQGGKRNHERELRR